MNLSYKKLFSVEMWHDFYAGLITHDFDIVPTEETKLILKNNNLLFKSDNKGFRILYRALLDSPDPFFPLGNFDLRFTLALKANPAFTIVTDLSQLVPAKEFVAGNLAYFSNAADVTETDLAYKVIDELKSNQFTYKFPQTTAAAQTGSKINIKNEATADVTPTEPNPLNVPAVLDQSISPNVYKYLYPIDFSKQPAGLFTFHTEVATTTNEDKSIYIDNSLNGSGCFGIIKIKINGNSFPKGQLYKAKFRRKETKWRFIVVLKSEATKNVTPSNFKIDDAGAAVAPYIPAPVFTYAGATTVGEFNAAIFESDIVIPFYEIPKKGLNISKIAPLTSIKLNAENPNREVVSMGGAGNAFSQIYVLV